MIPQISFQIKKNQNLKALEDEANDTVREELNGGDAHDYDAAQIA